MDRIKVVYWMPDGEEKAVILEQTSPCAVVGSNPECQMHIPATYLAEHHAIFVYQEGAVSVMLMPEGMAMDGLMVDGEKLLSP